MDKITWTDMVIAAVAVLAFFRPDFTRLYQKLFRKGKVQIRRNNKMELGYTGYGHTLTLNLSLVVENEDVFIDSMLLVITNLQTNQNSRFNWFAIKDPTKSGSDNNQAIIEEPCGFLLKKDTSKTLTISFGDQNTASILDSRILPILEELKARIKPEAEIIREKGKSVEGIFQKQLFTGFYDTKVKELKESEELKKSSGIFAELFYWNPGKYHADIILSSFKPKTENKYSFNFEISKPDSTKLYKNIEIANERFIHSIINAATSDDPIFNFIYLDYELI